jgi:hypothetical protein
MAILYVSGKFGNICQYAKKGHFRKIQKKIELLASGEILFLFILDTYKTNKK